MARFALLLLCLVLAAACTGDGPPPEVLEEETYIDLLVELQLLQAYQEKFQPDSTTVDSLQKVIFAEYETTRSQFRQSHTFYQENIKGQRDRIGKMIENLRKDRFAERDSSGLDSLNVNVN